MGIGVGTFQVTPRMRELVNQVLDSGRISYGPMSRAFEETFAAIHGWKFAVLSNSGTSSLQVALQAMKELRGWGGGEVIIPSVTFVATANVVLHNGMAPVLVDVEPQTYGLNPRLLKKAITKRTRAIMPVHLFGMPCDMAEITKFGIPTVEDSCECMFARYEGKGEIACYSTYVAHLLTTGVGGISCTNDPDLAVKMRSLVNHGRDGIYISIDDDDGLTASQLKEVVSRRFRFETVGHSFRITELEAALGLAQLETWEEMVSKRRANAQRLAEGLEGLPLQLPTVRNNTDHSFMMYPIVVQGNKWPLCNHLEKQGIETREMLRLTDQPCYEGLWDPNDYPVATMLNESGFYVGCHQGLSFAQMDQVADAIRDFYEH